jgi:hypothetical protein
MSTGGDRLEIYHVGTDAAVYRSGSTSGGPWSPWESATSLQGQAVARPGVPAFLGNVSSVDVKQCGRGYAACCDRADPIPEKIIRDLEYMKCRWIKAECEATAFAKTAVEWVAGILAPVLAFLAANPWIIIGVIVVAAVVITIVNPPAGVAVLTVIVL